MIQIELHESGGIAGLERVTRLEDRSLQVSQIGQVQVEKLLSHQLRDSIVHLVRELERVRPRRAYGQSQHASDALQIEVTIRDEAGDLHIEVNQDPYDAPPQEFWDLLRGLRKLPLADD